MDVYILGGLARALQALASATPTILVGLFIASVLRYYVGTAGTQRLFGGESLRSLPQSWLIGMLLPVCSVGVLPILREMKRAGVRAGAITAFAISAPLFNPLSLLYGLTLSRPAVIIGFALASLFVVTALGMFWDRYGKHTASPEPEPEIKPIGIGRLLACLIFMMRETLGTTGLLSLVAVTGTLAVGMLLPHGALQSSVEQKDPWAPAVMTAVAIPIYATPMLAMSQLGMMFAHGNSPGAAFSLLLLGTGVNVATLLWIGWNYGFRSSFIWFAVLTVIVLGCAYAIDRPLIPPGIEPAGHTHAFDIYTNPYQVGIRVSATQFKDTVLKSVGIGEVASIFALVMLAVGAVVLRWIPQSRIDKILGASTIEKPSTGRGDIIVPPSVVGLTCIAGLVAFSIVGCYAYYPDPNETLEEMRIARVETLGSANEREKKRALEWIGVWDEWSRKLEVGYAIRHFELRPYQQAQAQLLRKKLELLEHELEHDPLEQDELRKVVAGLSLTSQRLSAAFSK
ncbi:MAG: permease [Pirellulaceae bacterium]|nr:permease [Pirellulaceae bacterium]